MDEMQHTLPISRFGSLQAPTGLDTDDEVRIVLNDFEDHDQQNLMQRYADTPAESWEIKARFLARFLARQD